MSMILSRRAVLIRGGMGLLTASGVVGTCPLYSAHTQLLGPYTLPPLPYKPEALEP
jgi:hypothetical protein